MVENLNITFKEEGTFLKELINVKDNITSALLNNAISNNKSIEKDDNKVVQSIDKSANDVNKSIKNNGKRDNKNNDNRENKHDNISDINNTSSNNNKTYIELIGDSHLNAINERGLSKMDRKVNIRRWSGGGTEDMINLVKSAIRNKPEEIINHAGSNDLTNDVNPLNNIKKIVKMVNSEAPDCKVTFSGIMIRKDRKDVTEKRINESNNHLKNYCEQNNCGFIDNSNIEESFLSQKKLHMSKKGSSILAKNILNHMNQA